jgi:hypothetical protein
LLFKLLTLMMNRKICGQVMAAIIAMLLLT